MGKSDRVESYTMANRGANEYIRELEISERIKETGSLPLPNIFFTHSACN